jgi:membrane protein YdbS with pleckstrin-like domain
MAIVVLGAFVAIWMLFVIPAERRHHERKMELVRKKIERRKEQFASDAGAESGGNDGDPS